jgi:hypothetical protein
MAGPNETAPKTSDEILSAIVKAIAGIQGTAASDNSATVYKDAIKLTDVAAKQLLDAIMADIQFTGKLSKQDLADFVTKYNAAANAQLETVVQTVRNQTKPGDTAEDIKNIIKTTSPTFFDPKDFAKDYLWTKVNFADEKTLGAKALDALTNARQIAKAFNLSTVSDIEIQDAAKRIATGKITAEDYKTELAAKAAAEYPQIADRIKNTPGATVRSLYNPVLKAVADVWEVDADSLDLNDPFIDSLIRPDGVVGKMPSVTVGEATRKALMHPNADKAEKQISNAKTAAASLARAMGFGI